MKTAEYRTFRIDYDDHGSLEYLVVEADIPEKVLEIAKAYSPKLKDCNIIGTFPWSLVIKELNKTRVQRTYKVEYKLDSIIKTHLVEADSMTEAVETLKSFNKEIKDSDIVGVYNNPSIIKRID